MRGLKPPRVVIEEGAVRRDVVEPETLVAIAHFAMFAGNEAAGSIDPAGGVDDKFVVEDIVDPTERPAVFIGIITLLYRDCLSSGDGIEQEIVAISAAGCCQVGG